MKKRAARQTTTRSFVREGRSSRGRKIKYRLYYQVLSLSISMSLFVSLSLFFLSLSHTRSFLSIVTSLKMKSPIFLTLSFFRTNISVTNLLFDCLVNCVRKLFWNKNQKRVVLTKQKYKQNYLQNPNNPKENEKILKRHLTKKKKKRNFLIPMVSFLLQFFEYYIC